jgi:glycosyltransferase 2 family protein
VLEWAIIVACYQCLFLALPETAHFQLMDVLIFVGFVAFGSVVQIPGIGGGMQIVSIIVLTELFGTPLEIAAGVAVVLWVITFVVILPFGLFLAFHEGLNWRKLRQLEQQAERLSEGAPL